MSGSSDGSFESEARPPETEGSVFVQLNCAASMDGKLATRERRQVRISGEEDMERVHRLRNRFDGIAVGIGTVMADDPKLTAKGGDDPVRVVVDSRCRTPVDAELLSRGDSPVVIGASEAAPRSRVEPLEEAGADVVLAGEDRTDLAALLEELSARGISNLLVEGGGELNFGFFEAELVDRVTLFTGSRVFGGSSAPTVVDGDGFDEEGAPRLTLEGAEVLGDGVLSGWSVENG